MSTRALTVVVVLLCGAPLYAQTLGTITGDVKDASGATIPGSTVTVTNVATNAARTQSSNEVGAFTFPAMPPGVYVVAARPKFELIAHNVLSDDKSRSNASLAVSDGQLFLRNDAYLYCIGKH